MALTPVPIRVFPDLDQHRFLRNPNTPYFDNKLSFSSAEGTTALHDGELPKRMSLLDLIFVTMGMVESSTYFSYAIEEILY